MRLGLFPLSIMRMAANGRAKAPLKSSKASMRTNAFYAIFICSVMSYNLIYAIRGPKLSKFANISQRMQSTKQSQSSQPSIAIIGSGLAGCSAANQLAKHGFVVHLFESGRGAGGRSSTRRHGDFYFDHGAQYISRAKTPEFQSTLNHWAAKRCLTEWSGQFVELTEKDGVVSYSASTSPRYVGQPQMNSLCKVMLEEYPAHILTKFSCKVNPHPTITEDSVKWRLIHDKTGEELGGYDWIVLGDRNLALSACQSLSSSLPSLSFPSTQSFTKALQEVYSPMPSLSLLLAFSSPLPRSLFPYDSLTINAQDHPLGWISRDSSKPGRQREDNKECWVVQSTISFAQAIIREVNDAAKAKGEVLGFEERKQRVNVLATERLLSAFQAFLYQHVPSTHHAELNNFLSSNVFTQGHRWSAAFPSLSLSLSSVLDGEKYADKGQKLCYVDTENGFVACGDYLPDQENLRGRIEGAVRSGQQAAEALLDIINN